jgi:two-component system, OmpR family, response regulator
LIRVETTVPLRRSAHGPQDLVTGQEPRYATRLLVVGADREQQQTLVDYLGENNMRAMPAMGRREVAQHFAGDEPSLVVLDLHPGEAGGLDLLREIRAHSDVPVIVTGAHQCEAIDRIIGLELGADDYLVQPFGLRELLARIRAVLRRRRVGASADPTRDAEPSRCRFGGWELNRRTRRLTDPDGCRVMTTKGEYALLCAFLDAPQRQLCRDYLLQATRIHEDVSDRSIDVAVLRLRRKLERDPSRPRIILSERGAGYLFALAVEWI